MLKKKSRIFLIAVFALICLAGLICSLVNMIGWKNDVDNNQRIREEITENVVFNEEKDAFKIDFEALKKRNEDTIAYLKVNGTNIDYVVVKGGDNKYYLRHNFDKEYSVAGWVFADYHNKLDGSDRNIIIYGHNMQNGSMFETLRNTLNSSWQKNEENLEIDLVTEHGAYKYRVFSNYVIEPEDYYINTELKDDEQFEGFVDELERRSIHNYGIEVGREDKILTLSSCIGDGSKRVVLHAKLIKNS